MRVRGVKRIYCLRSASLIVQLPAAFGESARYTAVSRSKRFSSRFINDSTTPMSLADLYPADSEVRSASLDILVNYYRDNSGAAIAGLHRCLWKAELMHLHLFHLWN